MKEEKTDKTEKRILIVDDDVDFADSIVEILEMRSYMTSVINKENGIAELLEDFNPHVALIDIRLGQKSGIALIEQMKEIRPAILCVMVTAYASVETALEAIQCGAYDYLRKPVNVHDLLRTLDRCFEKIRYEQERMDSQNTLFSRLLYEEGIAACSHTLLMDSADALTETLSHLMTSSGAHRVYLYENYCDPLNRLCMRQTHSVCTDEDEDVSGCREMQDIPYVDGFTRWEKELSEGRPVSGLVKSFPKSEQEVLYSQNVLSILVLPVQLGEEWYGFIGFDDIGEEREWSKNDIRLLRTAAEMIGSYIKRKMTDESVRKSGEQYRLLANNVNDVIWTTDLNFRITYITPSIEKLTGYKIDEIMKMGPEGFLSLNSSRWVYKMLNIEMSNILEGKFQPAIAEMKFIRKDGSPVIVESTVSILYDRDKKATHIMGITRDITERKKAEAEREKMQARLLQSNKMEAIGSLAGGIAHDFNNILSGIFGYTELALAKLTENDAASGYLQELLLAARRAKGLINQILTLSCQQEHEQKPISIGPIIEEALRLISVSLPVNIAVLSEIKAEPDIVNANSVQIHQIIMNLCTNAVHAMRGSGGILTVKLENADLSPLLAANYSELSGGPYLRLEVSDTGHGIPADIIGKIFDPFFTTKGKGEGSGLGLSVVHGIVKSHGGAVYVSSKIKDGTEFEIFLPLSGSVVDKAASHDTSPLPEGSENILLIDDESVIVNMEKDMLEDLGYDVAARTSSIEALEAFKSQPRLYDLIITDQTMPKMNGAALAKEITDIRRDIPVILCTGFSEQISHARAKSMGITELLLKPITTRDLAETVRRVLDRVKRPDNDIVVTGGQVKAEEFSGKKVLIADDIASNLSLIKRMLAILGCESETASNGEEALKFLKANSFDLVLMDINMPVMDGIEATMKIRTELNSTVPVVAITGKDLESNRETFLEAGINDFLMKPLSIDGLKNMLRKWTR